MGGVLEACPDCGVPMADFESESYQDGIYHCEDFYCPECNRQTGGFADPIYL